jgi:hypothetical protein
MAAIQRMLGMGGPGFGDLPGAPGMNAASSSQQDPMSSFPFNPAMMAGMQPVQTTPDNTAKYWTLAHFVTMALLGIYAIITEFKTNGRSHFASLMLSKEPDSPFSSSLAFVSSKPRKCMSERERETAFANHSPLILYSLCSGTL